MHNFSYAKAHSVPEAIQLVHVNPKAAFVAGGTNIIDLLKYNVTSAGALVDVNHIEGYHGIEEREDGTLRLGAFATNADTAYHPLIEERYPLLSKAILAGASAQIRNMATNGETCCNGRVVIIFMILTRPVISVSQAQVAPPLTVTTASWPLWAPVNNASLFFHLICA